jgi:hypothetical protein
MSKWISIESADKPKLFDTVLGYTGDGVNDLNNACDYVSMYLDKDGFFHDANDDVVSVTYWRKRVRPPSKKDKKKQKWYDAAVCLPLINATVEVKGVGRCVYASAIWINTECKSQIVVNSTDKWRPVENNSSVTIDWRSTEEIVRG